MPASFGGRRTWTAGLVQHVLNLAVLSALAKAWIALTIIVAAVKVSDGGRGSRLFQPIADDVAERPDCIHPQERHNC